MAGSPDKRRNYEQRRKQHLPRRHRPSRQWRRHQRGNHRELRMQRLPRQKHLHPLRSPAGDHHREKYPTRGVPNRGDRGAAVGNLGRQQGGDIGLCAATCCIACVALQLLRTHPQGVVECRNRGVRRGALLPCPEVRRKVRGEGNYFWDSKEKTC